MTNHFYLLLETKDIEVSKFMLYKGYKQSCLHQRKKNLLIQLQEKQKKRQVNIIQMPIKTVLDGHIQNMSSTVS